MKRVAKLLGVSALAGFAGACGGSGEEGLVAGGGGTTAKEYRATIRTTSNGVPHVVSEDYAGVGFGAGYVFARDAICGIAGRFVTVNAQRSRYFGPDEILPDGPANRPTNLQSDFFWQRILDEDLVEKELSLAPPLGPDDETRELIRGYVAGYNKYLADTGVRNLDDPRCRGAEWVRPITEKDVYLRAMHWNLFRSSANLIPQLTNASPPAAGQVAAPMLREQPTVLDAFLPDERFMTGSNMIALGGEATDNGRGMLFANPHWFWHGPERWYEIQLTVPGKLNVYGVQTSGVPVIQTGFTENVAWAGTSSFANRWTPYKLQLIPGKPTSYLYDGQELEMTRREVAVEVKMPDGTIEDRRHTFWETRLGLILEDEVFAWDSATAYAVQDVAYGFRWLSQQFLLNHSQSTEELSDGGRKYMAIGWRNLAAADKDGNVFYGDRTAIPHIANSLLDNCVNSELGKNLLAEKGLVLLDGTTSNCRWGRDEDSPVDGIFGGSSLPELHRNDYVMQSNDSHWLNNPRQPLEGYPKVMGNERTVRSLRTRNGLMKIEDRLAGTDGLDGKGFSLAQLVEVTMDNRVLSATLWKDALVGLCRDLPPEGGVGQACEVLDEWDGTENVDAEGAILWRRFYEHLGNAAGDLYSIAFDPDDPVNTPRGLKTSDPRLPAALKRAVDDLLGSGIPLAATYGKHHFVEKGGERLPVHGGLGAAGQYNLMTSDPWTPGVGYPNVANGASYLLWVQFTPEGPVGRSIMTYSQSPNPESPYFKDQTGMFGRKEYKSIRFTDSQIDADPSLKREEICARRSTLADC